MSTVAVPEQGQLVEVRGRRYTVLNIQPSTLPTNPVQLEQRPQQHLLSLASIEDDAAGEALEVVWELEQGAQLFEERELPYPYNFDTPQTLSAFFGCGAVGGSV